MDQDTQTPTITFEELFGLPSADKPYDSLDLQGMQHHLRSVLTYIEETRALHTEETTTIDEYVNNLRAAQKALRDAEVDHVAETQEIADANSGEIHDVLEKEKNEELFTSLLTAYTSALRDIKPYIEDTIIALYKSGKLKV